MSFQPIGNFDKEDYHQRTLRDKILRQGNFISSERSYLNQEEQGNRTVCSPEFRPQSRPTTIAFSNRVFKRGKKQKRVQTTVHKTRQHQSQQQQPFRDSKHVLVKKVKKFRGTQFLNTSYVDHVLSSKGTLNLKDWNCENMTTLPDEVISKKRMANSQTAIPGARKPQIRKIQSRQVRFRSKLEDPKLTKTRFFKQKSQRDPQKRPKRQEFDKINECGVGLDQVGLGLPITVSNYQLRFYGKIPKTYKQMKLNSKLKQEQQLMIDMSKNNFFKTKKVRDNTIAFENIMMKRRIRKKRQPKRFKRIFHPQLPHKNIYPKKKKKIMNNNKIIILLYQNDSSFTMYDKLSYTSIRRPDHKIVKNDQDAIQYLAWFIEECQIKLFLNKKFKYLFNLDGTRIDKINHISITEYSLVIANIPNFPGITPGPKYGDFFQKLSSIEVLYKKADNSLFPLNISVKDKCEDQEEEQPTLENIIHQKYIYTIQQVIKLFDSVEALGQLNSETLEKLIEEVKELDEQKKPMGKTLLNIGKTQTKINKMTNKIRRGLGIERESALKTKINQMRYDKKMRKYFREDHPIVKDQVFENLSIDPKLMKYFSEDKFLLTSKAFDKTKSISDYYIKGIRNFKWTIPDEVESSLNLDEKEEQKSNLFPSQNFKQFHRNARISVRPGDPHCPLQGTILEPREQDSIPDQEIEDKVSEEEKQASVNKRDSWVITKGLQQG